MEGIYRYLEDFDRAAANYLSSIVANTVGILGVRGLSGSGTIAQNFVRGSLAIGNQTSLAWTFTGIEGDASYMILYSPNRSTGMVMTVQSRQTTQVLFTFNPACPSGMLLDVMLLRT